MLTEKLSHILKLMLFVLGFLWQIKMSGLEDIMTVSIDSDKFIKTGQVSELLEVSEATIKRWEKDGKISSVRDEQNHRYYCKNEIIELKKYLKKQTKVNNKKNNQDWLRPIIPLPHPDHYLMHKYWGRKPHNVVSEYVRMFTNEGDTVLDPFMGSGVTIIEGAKLRRHSIGVDINPMSKFITDNTIQKVNLSNYQKVFLEIFQKIHKKYSYLYKTTCPHCGNTSEFSSLVMDKDSILSIRLNCSTHKKIIKKPDTNDHEIVDTLNQSFHSLVRNNDFPSDQVLQYVKRSGNERIDELFSKRAILVLSSFLKEIKKEKDIRLQQLLLFTFSSAIPNCSRMLPGNPSTGTYKSGWVISKFWVPKIHTERNPFECLTLRHEAILKGKSQILNIEEKYATTITQDSKNLKSIKSNSVDYIFTDPPYGESIAYLGLSHLWNSWLGFCVDYGNEIIIDPFRQKRIDSFELDMHQVFRELYRVLKEGKYMSFTFHNRDLKVWKAIVEPALKNGFNLVSVVHQPQAVSSGTQGINRKNTLEGDFIYNFIKSPLKKDDFFQYHQNSVDLIVKLADKFISKHLKVTASQMYEYLIPQVVLNHAFLDKKRCVIDLETLLNENFIYQKIDEKYFWTKKVPSKEKVCLSVLDLFAGAGGFSAGFKRAGFKIVSAVEFDPEIVETYKRNHPETSVHSVDIRKLETSKIIDDFKKANCSCDVIIGGPPCQGFSMAGNRIRKDFEGHFDERNELFMEFYRFVKELKPSFFVIENVEGILNYSDGKIREVIYSIFEKLGYKLESKVLLAADYGVPQLRKRAYFIGNRLGISPADLIPTRTHSPECYVSIWDAISDLPKLKNNQGDDILVRDRSCNFTKYQLKMGAHLTNVIHNHRSSNHSEETIEKMKLINNGQRQVDLPKKLQTKSVHSGAWGRMEKFEPAYTLTTRINTPSVGRIIHPEQNRTITPREAARIQSFSDDYIFVGGITSLGKQIGNAVSPLVAERIAETIKEKYEKYKIGN